MSANSLPKTPAIKDWIHTATLQLVSAGIGTAKLDAEIILAHTLRKSRTYLHAHHEELLTARHHEIADARLQLRLDRTPIAYIVGHKEFYGRLFRVTPATLIPRPESEDIITILKELQPKNISLFAHNPQIIDVGTGSGCLGITAKLELPTLNVTLLDISRHALNVAEQNAKHFKADVTITQSDLLANYPLSADVIIANLPYVDISWERSPETNYEPELALFATNSGLSLIQRLIEQTSTRLTPKGFLILEADPRQHKTIIEIAKTHNFTKHSHRGFILSFQLD